MFPFFQGLWIQPSFQSSWRPYPKPTLSMPVAQHLLWFWAGRLGTGPYSLLPDPNRELLFCHLFRYFSFSLLLLFSNCILSNLLFFPFFSHILKDYSSSNVKAFRHWCNIVTQILSFFMLFAKCFVRLLNSDPSGLLYSHLQKENSASHIRWQVSSKTTSSFLIGKSPKFRVEINVQVGIRTITAYKGLVKVEQMDWGLLFENSCCY